MKFKYNLATKIMRFIAIIGGTLAFGSMIAAIVFKNIDNTALYGLILFGISLIVLMLCEISDSAFQIMKRLESKDMTPAKPEVPEVPKVNNQHRCPKCGTVSRMPAKFCYGCGKPIR